MSDSKEHNITDAIENEGNVDGGVHNTTSIKSAPASTLPPPIAAPNSKPREKEQKPIETYVYRDFANAEETTLDNGNCHGEGRVPAASLQSQKLPSKLAAMLSDPGELIHRGGFDIVYQCIPKVSVVLWVLF